MFKKIVIPLDGSKLAEKVLPYLQHVTNPAESELVLVRNIELSSYAFASDSAFVTAELYEAVQDEAINYLKIQKEKLEESGFSVQMELARGDTATGIVQIATDLHADLIAMTTHGRTGLTRMAMGSVADRVVRSADVPILLVQAEAEQPVSSKLRKILVPLDGSELSEQALPIARLLASETDSQVLLLEVIESLADLELAELFNQIVGEYDVPNEWYACAEDYLTRMKTKLDMANVNSDFHVAIGSPADCILHAAKAESCDLIIMSTHGRSGISRWVYGSVTGKVLNTAKCPLLLVRGHVRAQVAETMPQFAMELASEG